MAQPAIREAARAKINVFLHVVGRRADGYHELDSLAVFPDLADLVQAEAADALTLEIEGPFASALAGEADNLVLRAARLLAALHGGSLGARLRLWKNLPVASGIGGGSADAAATLRALARLWRLPPEAGLAAVARGLGADVPVCLESRPAVMRGVGEILGRAPSLPSCGLALVNPGVPVATAQVFRAREGPFSGLASLPSRWADASAMARGLAVLSNDLEQPAIALHPLIAEVLSALRACPECLLARMSGSGATCFGLFPDAEAALRGRERLHRVGWWTWAGSL